MSDYDDLSGPSLSASDPADGSHVEPTEAPTNSEFMRVLLQVAPRGTYGWVCNFIGQPRAGAEWGGRPYQGGGQLEQEIDTWQPYNTYFSVGALNIGQDGEQARKKALFSRLLVLVVDDADLDELHGRPSYVLQTSPGKCQVGIFLVHDDEDCANMGLIDALMRELYKRGNIGGDPSGNNGVRYTRLPVGSNLKPRDSGPFRHAMTTWNPGQRLTLADAAAVVGVDLDELRERAAASQAAGAGMQLGPSGAGQAEKLEVAVGNVVRGIGLHESLNQIAASLVATGTHPGAAVSLMRALMTNSLAARDDRWQDRYADIPRAVRTAEQFRLMPPPLAAGVVEQQEPQKASIVVRAGTLLGGMTSVKWLIKGYLEAGAMSMLFGPPSSCKSFIAIDQACCVATGKKWHGNDVRQGPVIIVAGEGNAGLGRRLRAWEIQNNASLADAPLYVTTRSVPMLDAAAAAELVEAIDEICRDLKVPPVMVVIDTLARNFGAGDENSAKDASAFIEAVDTHIRVRYSCFGNLCHVVLVHHSGHVAGRERGSTAFPGAMDQRFEVKRFGDTVEYINKKMKDADEPEPLSFDFIKGIFLGEDDGDAILGAALKGKGDILNVSLATGKIRPCTVRDLLELVAESKVPSSRKLEEVFGLSKNGSAKVFTLIEELGLAQKPPGQTARWELTEEGLRQLSRTGHQAMGKPVAQFDDDGEGEGDL